jgi:hypothetical protein
MFPCPQKIEIEKNREKFYWAKPENPVCKTEHSDFSR